MSESFELIFKSMNLFCNGNGHVNTPGYLLYQTIYRTTEKLVVSSRSTGLNLGAL
jgi:hypothetical protein